MFRTALLLSLFACTLAAQTGALTDEQIVFLHKGGLTDDELLHRIASAPAIQFLLISAWTDYMLKSVKESLRRWPRVKRVGLAPPPPAPPSTPSTPGISISTTPLAQQTDGRTRIFVGEASEWQSSRFNISHAAASFTGTSGAASGGALGMSHAGLMNLTVSVMNQVNQHCVGIVVVNRPELADLFVRLDQSTTMWVRHDDMAVFNREGEMIFVAQTHSISKDAKRFCKTLYLPHSVVATP